MNDQVSVCVGGGGQNFSKPSNSPQIVYLTLSQLTLYSNFDYFYIILHELLTNVPSNHIYPSSTLNKEIFYIKCGCLATKPLKFNYRKYINYYKNCIYNEYNFVIIITMNSFKA